MLALTRLALAGAILAGTLPLAAQVRTIDPNQAIDADLDRARSPRPASTRPTPTRPASVPAPPPSADIQRYPDDPVPAEPADGGARYAPPVETANAARDAADAAAGTGETFQQQELLRAAEGTFGKGAAGLAGILERTLREQGQPNAYIAGREAAGAVVVGLRYGKGTMFHKVEGEQPVYWTGPSVGFDLGGDATKVFVLAYNLHDSEALYRRFPAAEGRLYFVGGFAATYLRRGNIVLIPIRLGVGWRQGVNVGYMKFSHKSKWLPF